MRSLSIIFCFLFSALIAIAQKENNTWFFGKGAGIDFNYNPPRPIKTGNVNSTEGCAVISDNNGHPLFYTNGVLVYNRKNEIMLNGTGLRGDPSSTNNVAIIPLPGNDTLFYLFAISGALQEDQQFTYNIINIKGDGGNGEVIVKNVLIKTETFEKLAAIKSCDNKKTWLVIHKWETDEYHSYLFTATGLNMVPVISHTGLVISGYQNNAIGTLKSSADGKKLVAVHSFQNDVVELMDFDNSTGAISSPILFKPNAVAPNPSFIGVYGAEFSLDNKLLYISANNSDADPCTLYQFDITVNNAAAILASKQVIAQTSPWYAGALQMGPDKKIYMAMWRDTAVSVIENPEVAGTGCNFKLNKLSYGSAGEPVQFGLPTFIQNSFDPNNGPFNFSRSGNCKDVDIQFTISRTTGMDSVRWFFGDAQESTVLSPLHHYTSPGYYNVKLIVYKKDCSGPTTDVINKKIWIAANGNFLGKDTSACTYKDLKLEAMVNVDGATYLWSTGEAGTSIIVNDTAKYWFQVEQNGCTIADTIHVTLKATPVLKITAADTTICLNKPATLSATTDIPVTYLWSTGEISKDIIVNKPGKYLVKVMAGCEAKDSINTVKGDCDIFIPTAFSPDGDGKNELFGIFGDFTSKDFSMQVFDRWGKPVFVSNNSTDKWDGTFKGKPMPNGAYPWIISYINGLGYTKRLKGIVLVLR